MRIHRLMLCLSLCASAARAQAPVEAPVGALRLDAATGRGPLALNAAAVATRPSPGWGAAIGAAVGAVVGAGVLALLAAKRVHESKVIDHSEDALVYVVYIGGGAVVGALVGTVAGLVWSK